MAENRPTMTFLPLELNRPTRQAVCMRQRLADALTSSLESARRALRTQLRLQQIYVDRYELSGCETAAAARALRWHGDQLVGSELPRI
jgi:hypothetical protein